MSWTNETPNATIFTNDSKSTASTWVQYLMHGKEPDMKTLADFTFESVVFEDGTQLKDCTFADLANQVWSNISKS